MLIAVGEAGRRIADLQAAEGAAGNISVVAGKGVALPSRFSNAEDIDLPAPVPELAEAVLIVTGSGRRLRDIAGDVEKSLGCLVIAENGRRGRLFTAPRRCFTSLTSELVSHLAVHAGEAVRSGIGFHALIHAQPRHVTYLSHIAMYREESELNRRLLRWQPETIVNVPDGVGVVPFAVPGTAELMRPTLEAMRRHSVVLWSKHGLVSRSCRSVDHAADLIDYIETAAYYEWLNLAAGDRTDGLTPEELVEVCRVWNVRQTVFR